MKTYHRIENGVKVHYTQKQVMKEVHIFSLKIMASLIGGIIIGITIFKNIKDILF